MLVQKISGIRLGASMLLAASLAACSLAPVYQRPESPVPVQWTDGTSRAAAGEAADEGSSVVGPSTSGDWQSFVFDDALRDLIDTALANNRELRQTLLNVAAARAQYRIQRAEQVPGLQIETTGTRQRVPDASAVQNIYQAGVGLAAFELDVFGRVRSLSKAALHEYLASEEAAESARISLIAEIIDAYLVQEGARRRHHFSAHLLEARETSLRLVGLRRERGLASALDVHEAEGLVQQARADAEGIDREFRWANNALALLVGIQDIPADWPVAASDDTQLLQEVAAGVTSEWLMRRPEIRAAEHRLQARNASIGAARAAFFPRISLTGMLGSQSADLSDLFGSGQRSWSFSPQITLPLFNGGANRSGLDLAHVRKDMAVAAYEQAIQTAFREVSDALAAMDTLRREEDARRAMAEASADALRLSEHRYRSGIDSHLRFLDAQRSDFANRMALIEVQTQRQSARVALFHALGGRWSLDDGNTVVSSTH